MISAFKAKMLKNRFRLDRAPAPTLLQGELTSSTALDRPMPLAGLGDLLLTGGEKKGEDKKER